MNSKLMTVCAMVALAGSSVGQVSDIGPFVGDGLETFENIASPGTVSGPVDIFGGDARANDPFAGIIMIALNLHSFVSGEEIFPYNGNLMGGSVTGFVDFTFDTPVAEFGGYFGTADVLSGGSVTFYDANDVAIDSQAFDLPLNEWGWYGWSSSTPIARVSIAGNANPGTPIVFDDLRFSFVPAPASAALLAMGGGLAARRRRG